MTVTTFPSPQQDLVQQAAHWIDLAEGTQITNHRDYEIAATHLKAIKELEAEADATFDPIIRKAHEAHREAIAQKKRITEPLTQAEGILKRSMGAFVVEQQRLREEEQRRVREETERLAAEAREAEIEEAEASGAAAEEVAALIEAPLRYQPVIVQGPARVNGISSREIWKAEVTNLHALVKFVAANPQFVSLLQPNTSAINGLARSLKSTMNIPGLRAWSEANIAARRSN